MRLVAGLHHPHIVRLLGYCDEYNPERNLVEQVLVYEFMPNGDLESFIKNRKSWMASSLNSTTSDSA